MDKLKQNHKGRNRQFGYSKIIKSGDICEKSTEAIESEWSVKSGTE